MDEDDKWYEKEEDITRVFLDYFQRVFTSSKPTSKMMFFQVMERKLGDEENVKLLREFTEVEIKMAVDQMHLDKAPGLDGMTVGFYKRYWNIVCQDITTIILGF